MAASINSYINIITFLLTTLFYYLALKPTITYADITNPDKMKTFMQNNYIFLAIYMFSVILIQFIVNASIISANCGGSIRENIGAAGLLTFIPWTLIFGAVILVLAMYPGFKSAFSDVVGYFYVSGSANSLLTELLINRNVEDHLDDNTSSQQRKKLEDAADAIVKICGNTSILINQMVPANFVEYWNVLKPLMKPQYQHDNPESIALRNELFEVVTTRDNIGEAMWFVYTGILLCSIVQLKINTRGCTSSPETMERNYKAFLEKEGKNEITQKQLLDTNYVITN